MGTALGGWVVLGRAPGVLETAGLDVEERRVQGGVRRGTAAAEPPHEQEDDSRMRPLIATARIKMTVFPRGGVPEPNRKQGASSVR